jgi:AcrR family transcriptional regulator
VTRYGGGKGGKRTTARRPTAKAKPDGRRLRSIRTRTAIVEAFLFLIRQKAEIPTAAAIAKKAGCSTRSVFERFSDFRELAEATFDYVLQQGLSTPVGDTLTRDRATRIAFHVKVRATNCENWLPLWRTLMRAPVGTQEFLKMRIAIVRQMSRARLQLMYDRELQSVSDWQREATLMALEALTDYEAWGRLREHYKLSIAEACKVWEAMTDRLLPPTPKR